MTPQQYKDLIDLLWEKADRTGLDHLIPTHDHNGLTATQIATLLPSPGHAILLLLTDLQEQADIQPQQIHQPLTDYLFEVIMAHLDAAQPHRTAIRRLWSDLWFHPSVLPVVLPGFDQVIQEWQKPLQTGALTDYVLGLQFRWFIFRLFHTWLMDDTLDQSKTMAMLDQGLKDIIR